MSTAPNSDQPLPALDLCEIRWRPTFEDGPELSVQSDQAILLEISRRGGLFQTSVSIPPNVEVDIHIGDSVVRGSVFTITQDEYGFLADIRVESSWNWFPRRYQPAYLLLPERVAA